MDLSLGKRGRYLPHQQTNQKATTISALSVPSVIHPKTRAVQCFQLIHNIRDRFPDCKIFNAFSVFEPSNIPSSLADFSRYGGQQLECLWDHHSKVNTEEKQIYTGLLVHFMIKYVILNNHTGIKFADLLTAIIFRKDQFQNAILLMEISRVLAVWSVECKCTL